MAHGHDVHFLERLERLSTPDTELALSLYQDPLLIRALLEQIRLPEAPPGSPCRSETESAARSWWSPATVTSSLAWPRACPPVSIR